MRNKTISGHSLACYPDGDPAGAPDGYPGSLYAVAHAQVQLVGGISTPTNSVFNPACTQLSAVAYDAAQNLIYITERPAGPWGATAVPVWQVLATSRWIGMPICP